MKRNGEHHEDRRPEQILAEIEHTRHEMDSTLHAIENRLTPGQLIDQGLDYLKGSGANEFVHNLGSQVKNNPMPIALMGIGIAWLMASGRTPPSYGTSSYGTSSYDAYGSSGPGFGERAGGMKDQVKDKVSGATQSVRERASSAMDSARGAMGSARSTLDSAKSTMSQAGSRVSELGQTARERMSSMSESARYQAERARSGVDYMVREQPLALGAIGLAVGALMAAMAPRTRKEDELMGEARDRLMDQAKEIGKEKLEDAKQVANEVANAAVGTVTKEAEKRGLTPPALGAPGEKPKTSSSGDAPTQVIPPKAQEVSPKVPDASPKGPQTIHSTSVPSPSAPKPSINPKPSGNTGGSRNIP